MFKKISWLLLGAIVTVAFGVGAAQQTINLGSAPNDGTGDTLRSGGTKINANFTELYGKFPVSAANGGTGVTSLGSLTKTDDTNVTLTLGGTPTGALINSTSLTLGWTGQLGVSRGGTGASTLTSGGLLLGAGTSALTALSPTDDSLAVGNGSTFQLKTLSSCSGAANALTYNTSTNAFGCNSISGSAAGNNTEVQFNNSSAFGADTDFTYNSTTNTLTVPNLVSSGTGLSITQDSGQSLTLGTTAGNSSAVLQAAGASNLLLKTNSTTRLTIGSSGQWTLNASTGSSGNVLTSGGASATPVWGSLDLASSNGVGSSILGVANGGLNLSAATDDALPVGNGTTWQAKTVPNCTDATGNHLNYTQSTNSFSCGTSSATGTVTQTTGNFVASFTDACSTTPTITFNYVLTGSIASIRAASVTNFACTGDSANFATAAGDLPASLRPAVNGVEGGYFNCTDNGTAIACGIKLDTDGTIHLCVYGQTGSFQQTGNCVNGNWTNTGSRNVAVTTTASNGMTSMTYQLN